MAANIDHFEANRCDEQLLLQIIRSKYAISGRLHRPRELGILQGSFQCRGLLGFRCHYWWPITVGRVCRGTLSVDELQASMECRREGRK